MMLTHQLYASQLLRIIATHLILCIPNFSLLHKVILIILTDFFDCDIPRFLFNRWIDCNSDIYQRSDKITDTICYFLLMIYIYNYAELSQTWKNIIIALFILRVIGVSLFLTNNNRRFLFYFPNFFLEIVLGLALIHRIKPLQKYQTPLMLGIICYKIAYEYYMHVIKS